MVSDTPKLIREKRVHTMVRELRLWDDMKEYWGFYLLKGSTVTVSTCTRWPGSSLTVIRGHKHLHECAFIGDDSSEEIDELMESIREGNIDPAMVKTANPQAPKLQESENNQRDTSAPSNRPTNMKRHRLDVQFHDVTHNLSKPNENHTLHSQINEIDDHDLIDKKQMTILLAKLYEKSNKRVKVPTKTFEDHIHKYRNQSVNQEERYNLKFAAHAAKREHTSRNRSSVAQKINQQESITSPDPEIKVENKIPTSEEVFQRALNLIEARGDKGKQILQRLVDKYNLGNNSINQNQTKIETDGNLKNLLNDAFHERTTTKSNQNIVNDSLSQTVEPNLSKNNSKIDETKEQNLIREKRELVFKLAKNLNQHDEEKDVAFEEGLSPDGIADHHEVLNETTLDDRSNSEFWSSFSSSEEALLNCAGLILNLPLTPSIQCEASKPNSEALGPKSLPNRVTYTVPSNGYYFFVFNSENEVQENYLRIQFDLHKTIYDVNNSVAKCLNSTGDCSLNLQFFSNEKLVLELPIIGLNDSQVSEEYVVISECEPRTSIYVVCVLAVPLVILLFAFQ